MRLRWAVLAVGTVVLVAGIVLLSTVRRLPPSFLSVPTPVTSATTSAPATPEPSDAAPAPAPAAAAPFRPVSVTLPAFGVSAPVDPVFTAAGVLAPPDDPARVGWWGAGALAGATAGTTVVVGHVDGPSGPGALYRLVHTHDGDHITVSGSGGQSVVYVVTSLQYHGKDDPLPASLFATDGAPRLVVISCGGSFDRARGEYADNVVVQGTPA